MRGPGFFKVPGGDLGLKPEFHLYQTFAQGSELTLPLCLCSHKDALTRQAGCSRLRHSCSLELQELARGPCCSKWGSWTSLSIGSTWELVRKRRHLCPAPDLKTRTYHPTRHLGSVCTNGLRSHTLDGPCQWNKIPLPTTYFR